MSLARSPALRGFRTDCSNGRVPVFRIALGLAAAWLLAGPGAWAQARDPPLPHLVEQDGRYALLVDGAPYLILGAEVNNSSGWPAELPKVWPAMEYLHANTVLIPVYWEQFEARPGQYDYSVVDTLLTQARAHQVRLILLWFATWKNGSPHYVPDWIKLASDRYPRMIDRYGHPIDALSPFGAATLEADQTAFGALMRHLKTADPQRTVLMVQVENESGNYGALRDYAPAAQRLFDAPVPPEVLKVMAAQPAVAAPSWQQAFGSDAEVFFNAWAVSKYVGQVAAAGKAEYALPMYTNAALRDPIKPGAPGSYESGGPIDNVIPIWKLNAPALDLLGPDIYAPDLPSYVKQLDLYGRDGNALFVPETGGSPRYLFFVLGHGAIGFAPFGIDFTKTRTYPDVSRPKEQSLAPWALTGTKEFVAPFEPVYRLFAPMASELARLNFAGKLQATGEEQGRVTQTLHFGAWDAAVGYGVWARNGAPVGNPEPMGAALVGELGDNEFLVSGFYSRVDFRPARPDRQRQFLRVEEGTYENGVFHFLRLLNGDQTDGGLDFGPDPLVLRVSLATY
jgi:hypothetical protein